MSRIAGFLIRLTKSCVREWPVVLLAIAAAGMFVAQCVSAGDVKIDDAYITFSFSKNLALGHGPLYSHGVLAEGYSTFLWMVLVALPLVITRGAAPLLGARLMAVPFVLLLGWAVYRLARSCGASRTAAAICVFFLSCSTDLAVAYLTGMETLPYVALVVFAFAATVQSFAQPRWATWAAWGGLGVALMRIDGFVPWGAMLGWVFLRVLCRGDAKAILRAFRTYGPPIVVYAIWFLWRWHYYGLFLPSTYYAKALLPILMPQRGTEYLTAEVLGGCLWCGLIAWLWLLWRRQLGGALVGCYVLLHWMYVITVGGDWMPFGRFVLPTVPLLVVLLGAAGSDLILGSFRSKSRIRWLVPLAPFALGAMMAVRMDHRFANNDFEKGKLNGVAEQTSNVENYLRAAEFLSEVVPSGGRLVTDYGGVFGYYTDGAVIEMWGLANPMIATRGNTEGVQPFYGRTCAACYPELQPEYFHVMQPLLRRESAFSSANEVIANVWQTDAIGRYLDIKATFAVGRAMSPRTGEALFFLQKRNHGFSSARRTTKRGFIIDYPFETAL
jgi:arabinofuranosyltransferase